jgi:hypothetical protein
MAKQGNSKNAETGGLIRLENDSGFERNKELEITGLGEENM